MLFTEEQFTIILSLALFTIFFVIGYLGNKRSSGFFLIFAGFNFIGFSIIAKDYITAYVSSFLIVYAIFIIFLGIKKAFIGEGKT